MKRLALAGLLLALGACGGSGDGGIAPPTGPLKLGIVSGNNQVATAGSGQLGAPVVGQLVRLPNGTLAFHIERSAERAGSRVLDLFVPRANAQTVVTGSPVPGAVVCAVSVDSVHKLVPFVPCTNTDGAGNATFFFTPGTGAGIARAEIRGTYNNLPAVFDTAKATVMPGVPADMAAGGNAGGLYQTNPATLAAIIPSGATVDLHRFIFYVRDKYNNFIAPASAAATSTNGLPDTTSNFTPQYAVRDATEGDTPTPDATGWTFIPHVNPTGHSVPGAFPYSKQLIVYLFANNVQLTAFRIQLQ